MREPFINLQSVLILIGSVQSMVLALVLVSARKGNKPANRILAALLFAFSGSLIDGFLLETNYFFKYPHLIGVEWPIGFLYGPLSYFYVRALTSPKGFAFQWNHTLHLIPSGMVIILSTPFYLFPADEKARLLARGISLLEKSDYPGVDPIRLFLVLQMAVYLVASLRLIRIYSRTLKQNFSSVEKIKLTWLRDLYVAFFLLWFVSSAAAAFSPRFGVQRESVYFVQLMNAAVILVMGIKGLRQPQIFIRPEMLQADEGVRIDCNVASDGEVSLGKARTLADSGEEEKYRKSSLTDEQSSNILQKLTQIMETGRPFLEPELTLPELSDRLSVSPNHLSQVINGKLKKSFFDFVNEYRVEEAKKLLLSPEFSHYSILGVAMEVGFNSKSAFYIVFKKHVGMTPSQFKDRQSTK